MTSIVESNEDGSVKKIDDTAMKYATLSDGRLVYKGLPVQDARETTSDDRNFRDGDFQSSLDAGYGKEQDSATAAFSMYNGNKKKFIVDSRGRVILQKDAVSRTTKISDEVRVVKGGSWLDTAYWLDPGQRRWSADRAYAAFRGSHQGKKPDSRIPGRPPPGPP